MVTGVQNTLDHVRDIISGVMGGSGQATAPSTGTRNQPTWHSSDLRSEIDNAQTELDRLKIEHARDEQQSEADVNREEDQKIAELRYDYSNKP